MAVVSSCCKMWYSVIKRTQPLRQFSQITRLEERSLGICLNANFGHCCTIEYFDNLRAVEIGGLDGFSGGADLARPLGTRWYLDRQLLNKRIYSVEVKEKSSHYGLDMLGYTCATRAKTVGYVGEILSKSAKIVTVRIVDCNSFTWSRNR